MMTYSIALTTSGNILYEESSLNSDIFFTTHESIIFFCHQNADNQPQAIKKAILTFKDALDNPKLYKQQRFLEIIDNPSFHTSLFDGDSRLISLKDAEETLIKKALVATGYSQKKAAVKLGISPRSLQYKISQHCIKWDGWRTNSN